MTSAAQRQEDMVLFPSYVLEDGKQVCGRCRGDLVPSGGWAVARWLEESDSWGDSGRVVPSVWCDSCGRVINPDAELRAERRAS